MAFKGGARDNALLQYVMIDLSEDEIDTANLS